MAKPRPKKKPERKAGGQLPLPTPRQPASSGTTRVLPMQLQVGDRLVDETGEWEVTVRPYPDVRERREAAISEAGPRAIHSRDNHDIRQSGGGERCVRSESMAVIQGPRETAGSTPLHHGPFKKFYVEKGKPI